jgi:hypothetical protein
MTWSRSRFHVEKSIVRTGVLIGKDNLSVSFFLHSVLNLTLEEGLLDLGIDDCLFSKSPRKAKP